MKKFLFILALAPVLTLNAIDLGGPIQGEYVSLEMATQGSEHVEELTDSNFSKKISQGYSIIDFYADWCGPCRVYGPRFITIAGELNSLLSFYKVNVDKASKSTNNAEVHAIPTTILYKNGIEVKRVIGCLSEQALRDFILSEVSE